MNIFKNIQTIIFDVNGVFTGRYAWQHTYGTANNMIAEHDAEAIKKAIAQGYNVAIITRGFAPPLIAAFHQLGIENVYAGILHKIEALDEYLLTFDLAEANTLYMGDGMPDYEVLQRVGCPTCPADADEHIKHISSYVSPFKGGEGCVKDVIEQVLAANANG